MPSSSAIAKNAVSNTDNVVTPSELLTLLKRANRIKRPVLISGPPGIGKTSIPKEFGTVEENGFDEVCLIHVPVWEPQDLKGCPTIARVNVDVYNIKTNTVEKRDVDVTRFAAPENFPRTKCLFIFDEVASAPRAVQSAVQRIIHERTLDNGWSAHPESFFVATTNRRSDNAGAGQIISSLDNRFIHCTLTHSEKDFTEWLLNVYSGDDDARLQAASYITGYLKLNPGHLYTFDPKNVHEDIRGCSTPRTLEYCADVAADAIRHSDNLDTDVTTHLIKGCVGTAVGSKLAGFLAASQTLPSVYKMLQGETKINFDLSEPQTVILILTGIALATEEKYYAKIYEIGQYLIDHGKADYAVFMIRVAIKKDRHIAIDKVTGRASKLYTAFSAKGGACDITL